MATKNTGTTYDFDAWDEAAEQAQLELAAGAVDVRYILVEGKKFVAKFPTGDIIEVPLVVTLADIEKITSATDDQIEQMKALLELFGDDDAVTLLEAQNLPAVVIFAEKYFRVFQKIARTSLGD